MKKFLINSILLLLFILVSVLLIIKIVPPIIRNNNDYVGASIDKEKRLNSINRPKIIFVGGSNLAFGLNSKAIEDSTGYPVVNMALHAGLGLDFILNEAVGGIKKNDICLLSLEYNLGKRPDIKLLTQLSDLNSKGKKYIDLTTNETISYYVYDIQRCLTTSIKMLGKSFSNSIYLRNGFTKEGDLTTYFDRPNVPYMVPDFGTIDYSDKIKKINEFVEACNSKGAKTYFVFPTCQDSTYLGNKKSITAFAAKLHSTIMCPILNTPESMVFKSENYFNSEYHMNKKGRVLRTQKMIEIIKENKIID